MSDSPPQPPQPPETELSRLQDAWEAAIQRGDKEGAAILLAHAAVEYVQGAAGPVGDGLGGGIIPLWGKAPKGSDWTTSGVGGLGGRGPLREDEIFDLFKTAGLGGADGIGVVCGSGLLVIDIDSWEAVPSALWDVLNTGHMASSRKNVEDRRAHIGWRVGPESYRQTMGGFDDLGPEGWTADGVGELRSGGGHIRIWGGGVGTNVAARDPEWFVGLPRAGLEVLSRLTIKPAAGVKAGTPGVDIYSSDLWEWLDAHTEERIEDNHGVGWSERNLDRQLDWFAEAIHDEGLPKYTAALRYSLKLAIDVAAEAVSGRMAYDGLYEAYRQEGLNSGDWDESSRRSAYERMWRGAVSRILDGSMDRNVQDAAESMGNPGAQWRPGIKAWEPRLDVDPDTGEILGRDDDGGGSSDGPVVTGPELQSSAGGGGELAGQDPVPVGAGSPGPATGSPALAVDTIGATAEAARAAIDRDVSRLMPVDDDGFMPSEQLLPDEFWESRGVLSFIRRWAWTRGGWPDAVLMGFLAGLGAALPCELVLDPSKATPSPLTLFVLGIDQSGSGKSRNQTLAMRLVRLFTGDFGPVAMGQVIELPLGTAEGIVAKFFKKRDTDDLKADKKALHDLAASDGWSREELAKKLAEIEMYTRKVKGVVIVADEAKSFMEMATLGGAGLETMVLTAWSGKGGLVPTYKNTDLPQFKPMSYRMSMVAAIQTRLAYRLMSGEQADSGFAQRLLIFPLNNNWTAYKNWVDGLVREWEESGRELDADPDVARQMVIEEARDWIDLELAGSGGGTRAWTEPAWTSGTVLGLETVADGEVEGGELWRMQIARDSGWLKAQLADQKMRFEDRQGDPIDAHTLFNQLRLAALLAVLDAGWTGSGRKSVEIGASDWKLAGQIVDCTRSNRRWLGRVAEQVQHKIQSEKAKEQVIREAEAVLHEDELSEESFANDLRSHMRRFHDPAGGKFKGVNCLPSCWYYAGRSQKRAQSLKLWRSYGFFASSSDGDEEATEVPWFPLVKVPGIVRIKYQSRPAGEGGRRVAGAVWYTEAPVAGGEGAIEIHPLDTVELPPE